MRLGKLNISFKHYLCIVGELKQTVRQADVTAQIKAFAQSRQHTSLLGKLI